MNPLRRIISIGCRSSLFKGIDRKSKDLMKCMSTATGQNYIVSSPYGIQDLPSMSIVEFIWENLDKWPDHTALVCARTGKSYKYHELRQACREFGAGILAELPRGSTVGLVMPNCPEFCIVMLGCLEAGMIVSPLNPAYGPNEIQHQIIDSGAKLVITCPSKEADVKTACPNIPVLSIGEGSPTLDQVRSRGKGKEMPPLPDPDSVAILPYSSGTTGLPKGVILTHSKIVSNIIQFDHPRCRMPIESTKDYQEVQPCVLPFFHIYGFTIGMVLYLRKGSKTITIPRFEPQSFVDVFNKYRPSIVHLVPPLVQFLAMHPSVTKETLSSLRMASNGAAPMSPAVAERFLEKKDLLLTSGYGLTESSPAISICSNDKSDIKSVGYIVSNTELKVVNVETGDIQDPTIEGEVCFRGPQIMIGYLNNEAATKDTIKDGWLHTGDIGYLSEEGKLYLVDRKKELIKVKGFQVAPVELERVFMTHPGVADCGVVGLPDDKSGETPVAFVVRQANANITDNELINYAASKVSSPYKRVTRVVFLDSIPRNASGKILRRVLKQAKV